MSATDESRAILIVDDEERLRKALERSLCQGRCRAQAVASAEEALASLTQRKIDLVITDLVMPGMDGLGLVRRIRSTYPGTKTIIITAYGSAESRQEAKALGVAYYLAKPFDLSYLRSRVNELLQVPEGWELGCHESRRWAAGRASHSVCSAAGKAVGAVTSLSRKTLRCLSPRSATVAAGKVAGAVSGVWLGIGQLASLLKHRS